MPTPHHSVFYRPDALPAAQPTGLLTILIKSIAIPITIFCAKSIATAIPIPLCNTNTGKKSVLS